MEALDKVFKRIQAIEAELKRIDQQEQAAEPARQETERESEKLIEAVGDALIDNGPVATIRKTLADVRARLDTHGAHLAAIAKRRERLQAELATLKEEAAKLRLAELEAETLDQMVVYAKALAALYEAAEPLLGLRIEADKLGWRHRDLQARYSSFNAAQLVTPVENILVMLEGSHLGQVVSEAGIPTIADRLKGRKEKGYPAMLPR